MLFREDIGEKTMTKEKFKHPSRGIEDGAETQDLQYKYCVIFIPRQI